MTIRLWSLLLLFLLPWGCSTPREGIYHTVEKGETLYRISRAYGVDERYLARLNGVDDPSRLEKGQLIYIPSATRQVAVPPITPASSPPPSPPSSSAMARSNPPPAGPQQRPAAPRSATAAKPPLPARSTALPPPARSPAVGKDSSPAPIATVSPAPAKKGDRGRFDWPVRGRIVRSFGPSGLQSCQGVEIAAPAGTPVLSASEGTVTYSGNGIRGYGNLIILKHEDAYFTVYAFNRKNLVKAGARVARGEKIALSGAPPGGGEEALHFEIRRGKTAVNPIFYLP